MSLAAAGRSSSSWAAAGGGGAPASSWAAGEGPAQLVRYLEGKLRLMLQKDVQLYLGQQQQQQQDYILGDRITRTSFVVGRIVSILQCTLYSVVNVASFLCK